MAALVEHKDIPDADLHEAKGAAGASAGQVLTAVGDGTATFQPPPGAGVFGTELTVTDDLADSVTTSTTFQEKLTMTTGAIPAGTYMLMWSYGWSHDSTTSDFEAQIEQDNTTQLMFHKQEPKDAAGASGATGTSQRHVAGGHLVLSLAAGSFQFDLDWRTDTGGNESSIWDARFTFYRLS